MHALDWTIVGLVVAVLAVIGYTTKRHVQGVADFLAANRSAGRYLVTLADGMASLGAIGIIGAFQQNYQAGLGAAWWGGFLAPLMLLLPLTGFIIYRFRESRVMTIAEFYERRYSRRFRIFTGILAWVAGVINYGVFPQVTARFFIYFCDIPRYTLPVGPFEVDVTLGVVMGLLLAMALFITFRGGQIAIMVTDFLQAQYVNVVFLIVIGALFWKIGLGPLFDSLQAAPDDASLINPFQQGSVPDFHVLFFIMMAFNWTYTYMAWQGNQGYNCSARTPHEAKMARILAAWRYGGTWTVILLIPLFCYALINGNVLPEEAAAARTAIEGLGDEGLQRQLTVPIALQQLLPVGILGLFVAAMLAAAVSTDDTYLHSWGSIFIQDVLMPFRKKPLEPAQHMRWLRRSIFGVAVFVWVFGMLFPLYEYIFMYWAITGAIYVGGAGAVIIGGFYWSRGTTAGAWAGMLTGSLLATLGVLVNNVVWPYVLPMMRERYPNVAWLSGLPEAFWLNGMEVSFYASLIAVFMYVSFSLLTKPKPGFSMDKLLHRGEYADPNDRAPVRQHSGRIQRLLGIDDQYTAFDKFVAVSIFAWTIFWLVLFIGGTILGLQVETTEAGWWRYWLFHQGTYLAVGCVTVVWFLIGGFRDLFRMLRDLNQLKRDATDDGFVRSENAPDDHGA